MTGLWTLATDVATASDQLAAAATSAWSAAERYELGAGRVTEHDPRTIAETSAAFEAVYEAARKAREAARAAAVAADLAAAAPPPEGRDPELERMELIVSFHEAGHAEYARLSTIFTPVSAEIEVDRRFFFGIRACGMVEALYIKDPRKWSHRDYVDSAGLSLAGTAAECLWLQRVEGANYSRSKSLAYATHSSTDYGMACDDVGEGTPAFRKAERWAKALVTDRWEHIIAMAEALREHKRMSRGQISRVA